MGLLLAVILFRLRLFQKVLPFVCCLHKGAVELPSDMQGIVYVSFKESVIEVRDKIAKELRDAHYDIQQ